MDKKEPISFHKRKREIASRRSQKRRSDSTRTRSHRYPPRPAGLIRSGQWDDVTRYWQHFLHHPGGGGSARFLWTERMLWGNGIGTALLVTIGYAIERGPHFLLLFSSFVGTLFFFFLMYYLLPWVIDWVLARLGTRFHTVDALKSEVIAMSGWIVIASLTPLIPWLAPWPYYAALLGLGILVYLAARRQSRAAWTQAALATAAGAAAVFLVQYLLSTI